MQHEIQKICQYHHDVFFFIVEKLIQICFHCTLIKYQNSINFIGRSHQTFLESFKKHIATYKVL